MNIIFLGAPGSGKGTQAEKVAEHFHLAHISGGESLRKEAESGTRKGILIGHVMAKGELVPFETISSVIEPDLLAHKDGFLLDGTPRDLPQAEYLETFFAENKITVDIVFYLSVPEEKLIDRLLQRAKIENRQDDTLESIKERFVVFKNETLPVLDFYRSKNNFIEINGDRPVEEIAEEIRDIISAKL